MSEKDIRNSVTAIHPGEILKDMLLGHNMSQKELAATIGKSTPVVNDILSKKRDINVEIAILLEAVFEDTPAAFWLDCQSKFDIELTRQLDRVKELEQGIKDWKSLEDLINFRVIKKRAGIGDSVLKDLGYLCDLYKATAVSHLRENLSITYNSAYFKKSEVSQTDIRNLNTWILLTRIANEGQKLSARFNIDNVKQLINRLNDIFFINVRTLDGVKSVLNEFGIKFFVEKKLDKVPVDGYSFWLDENPTIVVTTRYSWLDNLAFTIFHELGHIVSHLYNDKSQDFLDIIEPGSQRKEETEKIADDFATTCLRRGCDMLSFFKKIRNPFSAGPLLCRIANTYSINEGIVVGQYQHYCNTVLRTPSAFAIGAKLKQKIK
ncbi:MAG: HigA family addiction module antidote protein [Odoribacter sp.]|nr:HigA family addiction module antidote protein [Odoribacter sp.]